MVELMTDPHPNNRKIDLSQSLIAVMINTSFIYLFTVYQHLRRFASSSEHTYNLSLTAWYYSRNV